MFEMTGEMAPQRAPLTCLIVDDSAFMRFHLKRLMDAFDNVVAREAANGNEAVTEYARFKPDIVLMDIVMPGLGGIETVKQICEHDPLARVIMISSLSYHEKVEEALAAGAKCFVAKPVTTEQLRQAIDRAFTAAA
ncbi:MAG: response regulator [Blastocatellia bacterium]|jgi:two-component system chemotaxis response regulator CheY